MKQYRFYALYCLLAIACSLSVQAQELRTAPSDPKMPQAITLIQPVSTKGSFTVTGADKNGFAYSGTTITIALSANPDYQVSDNLVKVYQTGSPTTTVSLTTSPDNEKERTFAMPDYAVTIEVDYLTLLTANMISLSSSSATYNGQEQKPTVTVTAYGTTLTENTHYTLDWGTGGATGTPWKDAGTYALTVTPKAEGGYSGSAQTKDFNIEKAPLTITPKSGQVVYADEAAYAPAYEVNGLMSGDENIPFTGSLTIDGEGKIIDKNLSAGNNYTITVTENISVDKLSGNASAATAALQEAPGGKNDWYNGAGTIVTLQAPAGFQIKETAAPISPATPDAVATSVAPVASASLLLRDASATDEYTSTLTFTAEGDHTVWYKLKRDVLNTESAALSIAYKLDTQTPALSPITVEDLTATIKLTDATSGLASCTYTWEGGAVQTATITPGAKEASFSIKDKAGTYHLTMTVKDQAGNILSVPSTEVILKEQGGTTPPDPVDPPVDPEEPPVDPEEPPTPPVANETLSAGAQLTVFRHAFRLQTDRAATLYIVTISGRLQRSIPVAPGETRVDNLPSGAYILCLSSGERWKVMMR